MWLKNNPFISRSRKDNEFVECCSCTIDINVAGVGKHNLTRHDISENRRKNYTAVCETHRTSGFL